LKRAQLTKLAGTKRSPDRNWSSTAAYRSFDFPGAAGRLSWPPPFHSLLPIYRRGHPMAPSNGLDGNPQ